jgi:DNA-binding transcriptional LysR family regulator
MVTPPAQAPSALPRLNAADERAAAGARRFQNTKLQRGDGRKGSDTQQQDQRDRRDLDRQHGRKPKQHDRERGDHTEEALPPPIARASDGEAARRLCLGGVGLARLALFHIGPDIESGRLVPVLQSYNPGDREDIHAVYVGHAAPLPARVRAFIDFLAEHVRVSDPTLKRVADGRWKLVG